MERPYPSHAPIRHDGKVTPKAVVATELNQFFAAHGGEFAQCRPAAAVAWAIYRPYSHLGAWTGWVSPGEARVGGHPVPPTGLALTQLHEALVSAGLDLDFIDVQQVSAEQLHRFPCVVLSGTPFMDTGTQDKLAVYAAGGGRLIVLGDPPWLDDTFRPCTTVRDVAPEVCTEVADVVRALSRSAAGAIKARVEVDPAGSGLVWVRVHPDRDVHYVVALSRNSEFLRLKYRVASKHYTASLVLVPATGAGIRAEYGEPRSALIRGTNEYLQRSVRPRFELNGRSLSSQTPGDLLIP